MSLQKFLQNRAVLVRKIEHFYKIYKINDKKFKYYSIITTLYILFKKY